MNVDLVIILLTIIVVLLSLVIITFLTVLTIAVVKFNKIARNVEGITTNLSSATAWLAPAKLFAEALKTFRK